MMSRHLFKYFGSTVVLIAAAAFFTGCTSTETKNTVEPPTASEQADKSMDLDDGDKAAPPPTATPTEADMKPKGSDFYDKLKTAVRGGNSELIRDEAGKILSASPNDPVALNTLALYYFRKNKYGASRLLISRALEKNKDVASLYNNLGVIELTENDTTAAIADFKKALRLDDRHAAAAGNLGSILVAGGEYSKSLGLLESAYNANKSNAAIANNYAIALRASKDYSKAQRIYEDVVKASPRSVNALLNYSILLIDYMNKPKDGLALVYKLKFLETENRDIIARANALEKKAKAEIK